LAASNSALRPATARISAPRIPESASASAKRTIAPQIGSSESSLSAILPSGSITRTKLENRAPLGASISRVYAIGMNSNSCDATSDSIPALTRAACSSSSVELGNSRKIFTAWQMCSRTKPRRCSRFPYATVLSFPGRKW